MKKLIIILLLFLANSSFAQKNDEPFVGFFCGEELSYTDIAAQYASLIKTKNYNKILKGLYSKNVAENFFSVIVSEKLKSLNKIALSEKDYELIIKIKNSNHTVEVCEGCLYSEKTLKEAFEILEKAAEVWFNNISQKNGL